ncbi:hypothetical protein FIBSPDRAFT_1055182 [Athelia psychrophila]|uniref:Uncharacterized protein n=1 Tax=Athelia psychrophila TaxID=1759441 RepID=A0A167U564_9AGAM|nr:hypothetical protein FIBSPDRAFT_1055182 [Fibularhizoctonia sp. CBS 109695]
MPPSARKYGLLALSTKAPVAASGPVKSSTSSTSVSLPDMMASMEPSDFCFLGDISIDSDISSICSDSLDSIPLFPTRQNRPLVHFAGLRSSILSSPKQYQGPKDEPVKTIVSIPTGPRVRATLGEIVNVRRWTKEATPPYETAHLQWDTPADVAAKPWIFEGSIFAQDEFKSLHALSHRPINTSASHEWSFESNETTNTRDDIEQADAPCNRNALIFEREITLQENGHTKRVSLQVPANRMNPEMVDMMLELRGLSSYFANAQPDEDTAASQAPPTLIVSSSSVSTTLSFDSAASAASEEHIEIQSPKALIEHSAQSESKGGRRPQSMNLTEMMVSLRSRCASFGSAISATTSADDEASRVSMASFSNREDDDDEWAFADTLMNTYGETSAISGDSGTMLEGDSSGDTSTILGSMSRSEGLPSPGILKVRGKTPQSFAQDTVYDNLPLPPTSPLPSLPIPQDISFEDLARPVSSIPTPNSPMVKHQVRGILKACKSVRFAYLSDSESQTSDATDISAPAPVTLPSATTRKLPAKPARVGSAPISPKKLPTGRRVSDSAAVRPTTRRPSILPPDSTSKAGLNSKRGKLAVGRHSIGAKSGKEKRGRASSIPPPGRVEDKPDTRDSGLKSRMPVAVRNVLARFK